MMYNPLAAAVLSFLSDQFREMGIEVLPMGEPLLGRLKADGEWKIITF